MKIISKYWLKEDE